MFIYYTLLHPNIVYKIKLTEFKSIKIIFKDAIYCEKFVDLTSSNINNLLKVIVIF